MKLSVNKNDLNRVILLTQNIVQKKTTMPILVNFLISAEGNEFKISASDLDVNASVRIPAKVTKAGSTTVNAKVFSDLVKELPDGEVNFNLGDAERLEVSYGSSRSRAKIVCISAESYPNLPGIGLNITSHVSSEVLLDMFNKTLYAVSTDEAKFSLNGIYLRTEQNGKQNDLVMVATDGHRLAIIRRKVEGLSEISGIIMPRKGIVEFKKILEQPDLGSSIGIGINDGFFVVDTRDIKMSMRLITGEFPDYTRVMPKSFTSKAMVANTALSQAIKRASLLVSDKNKCVRFEFLDNTLKILSSSPEIGEAFEEVELEYTGAPASVGFNPKYLVEVLSTFENSQRVVIELNGSLGPAKIYSENDEGYCGIIMPMRL